MFCINLIKGDLAEKDVEEKQKEKDAELMKMRIEKAQEIREQIMSDCAREIAKIYYAPPDNLDSRVLKGDELESVKKACLKELSWWQDAKATLMVIDDFVNFCTLLSKPENHIKKPSGQYVEKEVPLRTVADMVNEMRGELTSLPNYTAYAKIMQVENGNQMVAKYKIKTRELPEEWPADDSNKIKQEIRARTHQDYCQKREIIEKQIRQKQEEWQKNLDKDLSKKPLLIRRSDIKSEKPQTNDKLPSPLPTRRH